MDSFDTSQRHFNSTYEIGVLLKSPSFLLEHSLQNRIASEDNSI